MTAAQKNVTLADLGDRLFATAPEAASILGCDVCAVRKAICDGQVPGLKVGATYRVPVAWLRDRAGLAGGDRPGGDETDRARE